MQTGDIEKTVKYRLAGVVQNIGFRRYIKDEAQKHNISGYAANENDGSLIVLFHGKDDEIGKVQPLLYQGPPNARIAAVTEVLPEDADFPLPEGFIVR